jgi:hypothetical protein
MAKVVGGAAGPHSPVVYKLPWEESEEYTSSMDKLRNALMGIGRELRRLEVDTLLVLLLIMSKHFGLDVFHR